MRIVQTQEQYMVGNCWRNLIQQYNRENDPYADYCDKILSTHQQTLKDEGSCNYMRIIISSGIEAIKEKGETDQI